MAAHRVRCIGACAIALAALAAPAPSLAQDASSLLNACWAPQALDQQSGENLVRKGDRRFDKPPSRPFLGDAPSSQLRGVVRRVALPPGKKLVALTFDFCEQRGEVAGYDGALVDYLRKERVKATFFAGGKWLRSHEERARQLMADPLFEIGSHGEAHRNLRLLAAERRKDEVLGPQRSYAMIRASLAEAQCALRAPDAMRAVAALPALFRFPFGACSAEAIATVNDLGLTAIQWDFSSGDAARGQSAQAIARALLRRVRPGSIVLAHANGRGWHTAAALPLAVPRLRAEGFEFVTVSELLAAGQPVVEQRCYDSRPGDTDRVYDLLARPARPVDSGWGWSTLFNP